KFLTAGESHGPALTAIIEGIPAGLKLDPEAITIDLRRRQMGYGRGRRMRIERDTAMVTAGLWDGVTIGSPIAILIQNKDWANWKGQQREKKLVPRPGHADLVGYLKYGFDDIQKVIERSSARETASRTAAGSVARQYLGCFGIKVYSHTRRIGSVAYDTPVRFTPKLFREVESSHVRCADKSITREMIKEIDRAVEQGDTLGGTTEVIVTGAPVGLGSYVQGDRRASVRLVAAIMSVPSVKAVEIGDGIASSSSFGSDVHDPIVYENKAGYRYVSNHAGGIVGGITNGEEIVLRAFFKPISTLGKSLDSVNLKTKRKTLAPYVRSDICIVPAGGVVCEAVVALVIADLISEKFGGDSMRETLANYHSYLKYVRAR
ncbi:MAG: chorismate synthase, partial [candidate division Zixibacteria bacterium]|nr:chorismate synthase [candidate division Zixibacteria bacterium]